MCLVSRQTQSNSHSSAIWHRRFRMINALTYLLILYWLDHCLWRASCSPSRSSHQAKDWSTMSSMQQSLCFRIRTTEPHAVPRQVRHHLVSVQRRRRTRLTSASKQAILYLLLTSVNWGSNMMYTSFPTQSSQADHFVIIPQLISYRWFRSITISAGGKSFTHNSYQHVTGSAWRHRSGDRLNDCQSPSERPLNCRHNDRSQPCARNGHSAPFQFCCYIITGRI